MLLSACMIVKNEALTIRKCLDSLQEVADEIIVVDTGSTDATVAIAESLGAKVYTYEWDDNFANARNFSIRQAQGQYILYIDADEYLDPVQKTALRPVLESGDVEGVVVTVRNYIGNLTHLSNAIPVSVMRVFRRGHEFSGSVHEQVAGAVMATGRPVGTLNLTIHHLGYIEEFVASRAKSKRNMALLEKELDANPDDFYHLTNMMAEYMRTNDYKKCADLGKETYDRLKQKPFQEWPHYISRLAIALPTCLWEIGEREQAAAYATEFIALYPWLTDLKKRYATMLTQETRWREAVTLLNECRAQGDPRDTYIDTVEGMGTYFAALALGEAWTALGDDLLAQKWYLQTFLENATLEFSVLPLVFLMPADEKLLKDNLESRISDLHTYGNYAEAYAVAGHPGAIHVIRRAGEAFGKTGMVHRAAMAVLRRETPDQLAAYVESFPTEDNRILLGLYLLDQGDPAAALAQWALAGPRGEYAKQVYESQRVESPVKMELRALIRDLVAMRATSLLRTWLPKAADRADLWPYLRHSPMSTVLLDTPWPGLTVHECEKNAERLFRERRFEEAQVWLDKADEFSPTVTKILLMCDMTLARGEGSKCQVILQNGLSAFPDSEVLRRVAAQLAIPTAPLTGANTHTDEQEDRFRMNPADIYQTTVARTMPMNIQMAQLHERAAMFVRQSRVDAEEGRYADMRSNIEQIQNILTFLRSSLDLTLEVARTTDKTYAFYYTITVNWYVEPQRILREQDEYRAMEEFWQSWAKTWASVTPA